MNIFCTRFINSSLAIFILLSFENIYVYDPHVFIYNSLYEQLTDNGYNPDMTLELHTSSPVNSQVKY